MAIHFVCPLGHPLVVPDERAGKKGRCPVCSQRVYVPNAAAVSGEEAKPRKSRKRDSSSAASGSAPLKKPHTISALEQALIDELGLDFAKSAAPAPSAGQASAPQASAAQSSVSPMNATSSIATPTDSPYAPRMGDAGLSGSEGLAPPGARPVEGHLPASSPAGTSPPTPNLGGKSLVSTGHVTAEAKPPRGLAPPPPLTAPTPAPPPPSVTPAKEPPKEPQAKESHAAPSAAWSSPVPPTNRPPSTPPATPPLPSTTPAAAHTATPPAIPAASSIPPTAPAAIPFATATQHAAPPTAMMMPPQGMMSPPAMALPSALAPALPPSTQPLAAAWPAANLTPLDQRGRWWIEASDGESQWSMLTRGSWPQTAYLFAASMILAAGLGLIPAFKHLGHPLLPQYVLAIEAVSAIEIVLALWLVTLPTAEVMLLVAAIGGAIAAFYASVLSIVWSNQFAVQLPLDLNEVRNFAGGWSTGNALVWCLISYALYRNGRLWQRTLRRALRTAV